MEKTVESGLLSKDWQTARRDTEIKRDKLLQEKRQTEIKK